MIDQTNEEYPASTNAFTTLKDKIYFQKMPAFGNKIFYSLGFLALTSLVMLIVSGITMAFMGPTWWLTSTWGVHLRSIHEWSVQAFIAILVCHFLVGFLTSAFQPPRRMVWVFGAIIFCLALIQTEFGFALRGDFSSQYRIISGADFWNGAHLGYFINPEIFSQAFAIHVAIIPITILGFFLLHYLLVHTYGISRPKRKDIDTRLVPANHTKLYIRGAVLVALIIGLAFVFPSPFVAPERITAVAQQDPALFNQTIMQEFDHTSGTATYLDSIDPYTFDTRQVYIITPYQEFTATTSTNDALAVFQNESSDIQQANIAEAEEYFNATSSTSTVPINNPVVTIVNTLTPMAQSGLYESVINQESPNTNYTYDLRFLTDTGVLDAEAGVLNMTTEEWGMVREETGSMKKLPPGAWWFAPIGMLNSTILMNDPNGDRDAASILGGVMLLFILFPYIPILNKLPRLIPLARFIWK